MFICRMNKYDKLFFPSDVRKFDWDSFCYNYALGMIRYIARENLESLESAGRRQLMLRIAHYFTLVIYYSLLALFYYYLGRLICINKSISSIY